jgi:hypothetical protein
MTPHDRAKDVRHLQQVHDDRYLAWRAAQEREREALAKYRSAQDALLRAKVEAKRAAHLDGLDVR